MNYKFDTHVHTCESSPCGVLTAAETIHLYKEAGYSGLCITDHYQAPLFADIDGSWKDKMDHFLTGYRNAKREGEKLGMDILLGAELRFPGSCSDYLLFGLTEEFLYEYPDLYLIEIQKLRELFTANNILFYQAHPFRPRYHTRKLSWLDGVEVVNGNPRHNSHNHLAYDWAAGNSLLMVGGSDCHQQEDVGNSGIITTKRITSQKEFLQVLREQDYSIIPFCPQEKKPHE